MKMNVTLSAVLLAVFLSVAVTKSYSQPLTEIVISSIKLQAANETTGSLNDLQTAYPQVYKKLVAVYSGISNLTYTANNKTLCLNFKNNNQAVSAVYAAKGKMKYAVTSLGTNLPATILQAVKKEYPGYSLYCGRHIQLQGAVVYHIIIENCHEYQVLNYANEEITAIKTIEK